MTEQVVLITWSPGMNCVAQSTQYAISSGGQTVASSEAGKWAGVVPRRQPNGDTWRRDWAVTYPGSPEWTFRLKGKIE